MVREKRDDQGRVDSSTVTDRLFLRYVVTITLILLVPFSVWAIDLNGTPQNTSDAPLSVDFPEPLELNLTDIPVENITIPDNITTEITHTPNETINDTFSNTTVPETNLTLVLNTTINAAPEELNPLPAINASPVESQTGFEHFNTTELLTQLPAEVGEPVRWMKRFEVDELGDISLSTFLPGEATDITTYEYGAEEVFFTRNETIGNKTFSIVDSKMVKGWRQVPALRQEVITVAVGDLVREGILADFQNDLSVYDLEDLVETKGQKLSQGYITGFGVYEPEVDVSPFTFLDMLSNLFKNAISGFAVLIPSGQEYHTKKLTISDTLTEPKTYVIEYTTPAPIKTEETVDEITKRVTISSELHYTNILATTALPEAIESSIAMYWIKETNDTLAPIERVVFENFTLIDSDGDGKNDLVEWTVPHLSNETFEITIEVLDVVTYLKSGDKWNVRFTTDGLADLTISPVNSTWTEFLTDNPATMDELEFLTLECDGLDLTGWMKLILDNGNIVDYDTYDVSDSVRVDSIHLPDYSCAGTATITNKVNIAGYATLKFKFGDMVAYAIDPTESAAYCYEGSGTGPCAGVDELGDHSGDPCTQNNGYNNADVSPAYTTNSADSLPTTVSDITQIRLVEWAASCGTNNAYNLYLNGELIMTESSYTSTCACTTAYPTLNLTNSSSRLTEIYNFRGTNNFTLSTTSTSVYLDWWHIDIDYDQECDGGTTFSLTSPVNATAINEFSATYLANYCVDESLSSQWFGTATVEPKWIYGDLGSVQCINGMDVQLNSADAPMGMELKVSTDAVNWRSVKIPFNVTSGGVRVASSMPSVLARYVMMNQTTKPSGRPYGNCQEMRVNATTDFCYYPEDDLTFSVPGEYRLCSGTYDLTDTSNNGIIRITSDDVHITCDGTVLNGIDTGFGFYNVGSGGLGHDNITIQGCRIIDYDYGYYSPNDGADDFTFFNNSVESFQIRGIQISASPTFSTNWNISNNTFVTTDESPSNYGILAYYVDDAVIENNVFDNLYANIYFYYGDDSIINNNVFNRTRTDRVIRLIGLNSGNYQSNVTVSNNIFNSTVSATYGIEMTNYLEDITVQDNLFRLTVRTYAIYSNGFSATYPNRRIVIKDNNLTDMGTNAVYLIDYTYDSLIDGNNFTSVGTYAVYGGSGVRNLTVANNTFDSTGTSAAIYSNGLNSGTPNDNWDVINNTIEDTGAYGFHLVDYTTDGTFRDNEIHSAATYGMYFQSTDIDDNTFYDNVINGSGTYGVYIASSLSTGNLFYNNSFYGSGTDQVNVVAPGNDFNTTVSGVAQGNFWDDIGTNQLEIYDADGDGFGDSGSAYPYSLANGGDVSTNVVDYGPSVIDDDTDGDPWWSDCDDNNANVLSPRTGYNVTTGTTFCSGTYYLNDTGEPGVIRLFAGSTTPLVCNGTTMVGNGQGVGIMILGNASVDGCDVSNYSIAIAVNGTTDLSIDWSGTAAEAYDIAIDSKDNPVIIGDDNQQWQILKLNGTDNEEMWNLTIDWGFSTELPWGVAVDNSTDEIYVVGYNELAFGSNIGWRILKLDENGTELWNKSMDWSASENDYAQSVAVDPSGDIIVGGTWINTSFNDWRVVKLSGSDGSESWNRSFNWSAYSDSITDVAVDSAGHAFIVGTDSSGGISDSAWRVMKLNGSDGSTIWNNYIDYNTTASDTARSVVVDSSDDITVAGTDTINGTTKWRIVKFNGSDGSAIWNVSQSFSTVSIPESVAVDNTDNPIIVGSTGLSGQLGFRTLKLDGSDGSEIWNRTDSWNSAGSSSAYGVDVSSEGVIYVVGDSLSTPTFGHDVWRILMLDSAQGNEVGTEEVLAVINNSILRSSGTGLHAEVTLQGTLFNNTIANNTGCGIKVIDAVDYTINNNTLENQAFGLCMSGISTDNVIYHNNFTNSTTLHASVNSSGNQFNTTSGGKAQGNYWDDVTSLSIYDSDADTFGDSGADYPYSLANGGNVTAQVVDYGPITTTECTIPADGLSLTADTTLCSGTYYVNDTLADGLITVNADGITVTCDGTIMIGNDTFGGAGIVIGEFVDDAVMSGCTIIDYYYGLSTYTSTNNITLKDFTFIGGEIDDMVITGDNYVIRDSRFYNGTNQFQYNIHVKGAGSGVYSSNVTIINNTFIGNNQTAINLGSRVEGAVVRDNYINGTGTDSFSEIQSNGISFLEKNRNILIANNTLVDISDHGIRFYDLTDNSTITNNTITDFGTPVYMAIRVGSNSNGINITNNRITGTGSTGIYGATNCDSINISNNIISITSTWATGVTIACNNSIVSYNNISASASHGISAITAPNVLISNNNISAGGGSAYGINMNSAVNGTIRYNNIYDSGSVGIYFQFGANASTIFGNNISNSTNYGVYINTGIVGNLFYNNSFYNSGVVHAFSNHTSNQFNRTVLGVAQGNFWDDVSTLNIFDNDLDGFGESGSQHPYNITNGGSVVGKVNDYGPLTGKVSVPSIDEVILNSTDGTNYTGENLTAYVINISNPDGDNGTVVHNWLRENDSILMLNMPFEANTGGNMSSWTKDYSGLVNNGYVTGATYNQTGGRNGSGAYEFDGSSTYINISDDGSLDVVEAMTITAWINTVGSSSSQQILSKWSDADMTDQRSYRFGLNTDNTAHIAVSRDGGALQGGDSLSGSTVLQNSTWYHVVASYNGRALKLYVNGVEDGSQEYTENIYSGQFSLFVSYRSSAFPQNFNGTIDDVQLYDRSLSTEQISALYENKSNILVSQETRGGETWHDDVTGNDEEGDGLKVSSNTLTVENITAESVSLSASGGSNQSDENLSVAYTLTKDADDAIIAWLFDGGPFAVLHMPFEPLSGKHHKVDSDMEGYWKFNGNAGDETANGRDGTINGAAVSDGKIGRGYAFDGVDDQITIAGYGGVGGSDPRSTTFWFRSDDAGTQRIISWGNGSTGMKYHIRVDAGNGNSLRVENAGGQKYGSTNISDGKWHHLAVTFNGTDIQDHNLYVDGRLETNTGGGTQTVNTDTTTNYVEIGNESTHGTDPVNGSIDEVIIWSRALSSTEVRSLYEEGLNNYEDAKDYSGYGNSGFVVDASWNSTGGPSGTPAYDFNGSNYIEVPNSPSLQLTDEITVAAWVYDPPGSWWDVKWPSRVQMNISNSGSALTDFQVNVTINLTPFYNEGKLESDCSDVRFAYYNASSGNEIYAPHWQEGPCNAATASKNTSFWVNVAEIANGDNTIVYLYYNNPLASDGSDGFSTFIAYDDFEDGEASDWTYEHGSTYFSVYNFSGNYVLRALNPPGGSGTAALLSNSLGVTEYIVDSLYYTVTSGAMGGPIFEYTDVNNYYAMHSMVDTNQIMHTLKTGGSAGYGSAWSYTHSAGTWYNFTMERNPTNNRIIFDNTLIATVARTHSPGVGAWAYSTGQTAYFDDIRVRKYAASPPTVSFVASASEEDGVPMVTGKSQGYALRINPNPHIVSILNNESLSYPLTKTWHHVAYTYDGSWFRLYVDGTLVNSTTHSDPINSSDDNLIVGQSINGSLDDVRIYSRALSAEQILAIYNNETDVLTYQHTRAGTWQAVVTPIDSYEDGPSASSNELDVLAPGVTGVSLNTSLGQGFSSENLTLNYTLTNSADRATVNWFRNGTSITVLNMPFEGLSSKHHNSSDTGLVGSWRFEGDASDEIGNYDGTVRNGAVVSDAKVGWGYEFDGSDDYIDIGTVTTDFSGGLTYAVWAYMNDSSQNWERLLALSEGGPSNDNIVFARFGTTDDLDYVVYVGAAVGTHVTASGALDLNTWMHLAVTEDSAGNVVIYKNGREIKSGTTSIPAVVSRADSFIGKSNWVGDDYYSGMIDEPNLWDRTLTASEIRTIYEEGLNNREDAKDYSGSGNTGTIEGAIFNRTGGWNDSGAYEFDGTSSYIDFANDSFLPQGIGSELSVSMWVKPTSATPASTGTLMEWWDSGDTNDKAFDILYTTAGMINFRINDQGTTSALTCSGSTQLTANQWNHIAVIYNETSNNFNTYIDGTIDCDSSTTYTLGPDNPTSHFHIGAKKNGATWQSFYNGTIDSVHIYNRTLTTEQITLLAQNITNTLSFNETTDGDVWYAEVTPNDGYEDGDMVTTSNVSIQGCTQPVDDLSITEDTTLCPGTYNLADSGSLGVILLTSTDDVTVTCENTVIIGTGSGRGISSSGRNNVEIIGCEIRNYSSNIQFTSTTDSRITNVIVRSGAFADIYITSSSNNTISNSTSIGGDNGIYISSTANNNTILNNTIQDSATRGMYIDGPNTTVDGTLFNTPGVGPILIASEGTIISNNNFTAGSSVAVQWSTGTQILSNTFSNHTSGGITSENSNETLIQNNTFFDSNRGIYLFGSGGTEDNRIINNTIHSNTLDGILLSSKAHNNTIANNTIYNNNIGISVPGYNNTVNDNDAYNNSVVNMDLGGWNNTIKSNTFNGTGTTTYCIRLPVSTSQNNTIQNNTIGECDRGLYISSSSANYNLIYYNTFVSNSVYQVDSTTGANNQFNTTVGGKAHGNFWDDIVSSGLNITDSNTDLFGDGGSQYPYNSTNGGDVTGSVNDWGPILQDTDGDGDPDNTDCAPNNASVLKPRDDLAITSDTTLCSGTYYINDSGFIGVIRMLTSSVTLSCNDTVIIGNSSGIATLLSGGTGKTVQGCTFSSYSKGVDSNADFLRLLNNNFTNTGYGVDIGTNVDNNEIFNNTFTDNTRGVYTFYIGGTNNITYNRFTNNSIYAIFIDYDVVDELLKISHNDFTDNGVAIDTDIFWDDFNLNITYNNFTNNDLGVSDVDGGSGVYMYISSNRFVNNTEAIYCDSDCYRIWNNTFINNTVSLNITYTYNTLNVWNNSFINSATLHAHSTPSTTQFNTTVGGKAHGNYWDDLVSSQILIFDNDGDGFGDTGSEYPYNNTNRGNVTGSVNDYGPILTDSDGDGDPDWRDCAPSNANVVSPRDELNVSSDLTLCSGTYNINDASNDNLISITSNYVTLTCNNTIIIGDDTGTGIDLPNAGSNITIQNCTVLNYSTGINLAASDNVDILFNNISDHLQDGMVTSNSENATIYQNYFAENGVTTLKAGIRTTSRLDLSNISQNKFIDNYYGIKGNLDWNLLGPYTMEANQFTGNSYGYYQEFTEGSYYVHILNNNFTNNTISGFFCGYCDMLNITGNRFVNNTIGFKYAFQDEYENYMYNNVFITNGIGVDLQVGPFMIWNNSFSGSTTAHANSLSADNQFNTTVGGKAQGNYWSDITTLDIFDSDSDGFGDTGVDHPYNSTNGGNVTGKVVDWGPVTDKQSPTVGTEIEDNVTLYENVSCAGFSFCWNITGNDTTFSCNGYTVTGNFSGNGIEVTGERVTIEGCFIQNFLTGIVFNPGADNGTAFNNTLYNNSITGSLIDNADGINTSNTTFWSNSVGLNATGGTSSIAHFNNFTGSTTIHAYTDSATNQFNTTVGGIAQGSYWDDILDLEIIDSDGDGYGDNGHGYPYNSANGGNVTGSVTDYGPVTNKTAPAPGSEITENITLGGNVSCEGQSACFNITGNDTTFDCNGYYLIGNFSGDGLEVNGLRVSIVNCFVQNFITGIVFSTGADNGTLFNSTMYNNSVEGLLLDQADGSNVSNTTFLNNSLGINSSGSTAGSFYYNNFTGSVTTHASSDTAGNQFNTTVGGAAQGNIWDDVPQLSIFDGDADGWGDTGADYPYNQTNGGDVLSFVTDFGPKAARVPVECGDAITANIELDATHGVISDNCTNTSGVVIGADDIFVDCGGFTVDGNGTFWGVNNTGYDNVTVQNCVLEGFESGIVFTGGANDGTILLNTVLNNSIYGIWVAGSNDAEIHNNTIDLNLVGLNITGGTGSVAYHNNFTNSTNAHAYTSSLSNQFNTTVLGVAQGNIWGDILNLTIVDSDGDNWGDNGQDLPYNITNGGYVLGLVVDNGPWTNKTAPDPGSEITENITLGDNVTCVGFTTCYNLTGNNITFDCNGYSIIGNFSGDALSVAGTGASIENCYLQNFLTGIIFISGADDGSVLLSTMYNNSITGILLDGASSANISNTTLWQNLVGINITSGAGSVVYYSNFTGSTAFHAFSSIAGNHFNTTIGSEVFGNFWDDVASLNIFDNDSDGYGEFGADFPYNLSNNGVVGGFVTDFSPVTNRTPLGCGDAVTQNITLSEGHAVIDGNCTDSSAIEVGADNITVDCGGFQVDGNGSFWGVNNTGFDNVTVQNCVLDGFESGIVFAGGANDGTIFNNTVLNSTEYGIWIDSSNNADIQNNTLQTNLVGLNITGGTGSLAYYNNFTSSTAVHAYTDSATNQFNTTSGGEARGNIWDDVPSLEIYDSDEDTWADQGSDLPYNSNNGGSVSGFVNDHGPWTNKTHPTLGSEVTDNVTIYSNVTCEGFDVCWNITGDNITFNCDGFYVFGNFSGDALSVEGTGVTIKNCGLQNFLRGIVYIPGADDGVMFNDTLVNNSITGIVLYNSSDGNVSNTTFVDNTLGINVTEGTENIIYYNNFTNSTSSHAYAFTSAPSGTNHFNITIGNEIYGNFWDDIEINDLNIFDNDSDGYGEFGADYPYSAANGGNVGGDVADYGPVTNRTDIIGCGDTVNSSITLSAGHGVIDDNCTNSSAIVIGADNITVDCGGFEINGNDTFWGVNNTGFDNVIVQNCVLTGFEIGIVFADGADSGLMLNNTLFNNTESGIFILNSSSNDVANNTMYNNPVGINITQSGNNIVYFNNFTNSSYAHAYTDNATNQFNTTTNGNATGNFWDDVPDLAIVDENLDGYGDIGADYPYNITNGGSVMGLVVDNGPVSGKNDTQIGQPALLLPADGFFVTDSRNPLYVWNNSEHTLSHNVTYQIQVAEDSGFATIVLDTSNITEETINTSHYNGTALNLSQTYYWRVRADDTINVSEFSTVFNFTLLETTSCYFSQDHIGFGTVFPGQTYDTLDDVPPPMEVTNNGNVNIKAKFSSTDLWITPAARNPSLYYQYRVGEKESGAWATAINDTWINFTINATDAPYSVTEYRWENTSDEIELDVRIKIPTVLAGVRSSVVSVDCEKNETTA